jgi:lipopolysaccharide transport system permease protein
MLAIYTTIFGIVFQAKWNLSTGNQGEFAIILFCGLIVFNLFSECVNRAPTLVLSNPNYVKKVVFPLETLAWISILSALFNLATSLLVLLLGVLCLNGEVHWTVVLWPVVVFPLILFIAGLSWFLSSLGVFLRDIGYITAIVLNVLLYLSPIFYPISAAPPTLQMLLRANPLSYVIEDSRRVILWGQLPDWNLYCVYLISSLAVAWLGFYWFHKTRKGFADVI